MKLRFSGLLIYVLLAGSFLSCGDDAKESAVETPAIEFKKEGELHLLKEGTAIKTLEIEIADTPYERETGLMYRESMDDDQGMLFIFSNEAERSFHMKNTYLPLDLIFYNSDSTVVSLYENAQPRDETSIPSNAPAQFVLEINAGKAGEWNIETGDKMRFTRD